MKLSEDHVKDMLNKEGYVLKSEYVGARTPMNVICPQGHSTEMRYNDFQQGHRCKICSNNVKYSYEYVKKYFEDNNYHIISTEYVSTNNDLDVICDNGHTWAVSFKNFKRGVRCKYCYGNNNKTQEEAIKVINVDDYELLSLYDNAKKKLQIKCPNNHIFEMRLNNFQQGQRCPVCAGNIRHPYEYVKSYIEKEGYELISSKYKNANTNIKIKCPVGHVFDMRFGSFKNSTQRCPSCSFKDKKSKPEKEILTFLKGMTDELIVENDRTIVKNPETGYWLELDLFIPTLQKAIEFNGSYWHSNDKVKQRDLEKIKQCKEKGIELFVVKEADWIRSKEDCLENIKNFIL